MSSMPVNVTLALSDDLKAVRLHLPPLPLEGLPEPLHIHLDLDAEAVDGMLHQLIELRSRMLPPPPRI